MALAGMPTAVAARAGGLSCSYTRAAGHGRAIRLGAAGLLALALLPPLPRTGSTAAGTAPSFEPPVLVATSSGNGKPEDCWAADAQNIFCVDVFYGHGVLPTGAALNGSMLHSTDSGATWGAAHHGGFAYPLLKTGSGTAHSISYDMPLPTDSNGTVPGPRSFRASLGSDAYSLTNGSQFARLHTGAPVSFRGLPHGSVATCSGKPDGGSCYCGNFGPAYGYEHVPWGRFPGDGLVFYGAAVLSDGSALISTPVCEAGSVHNSIAVFGAAHANTTDFEFRGFAARGSDFLHFANYTTGPTEHALTVLADGTVMMVFRNDGDGYCERPVGAYHNFYQAFSRDAGKTWTPAEAIAGSGCAWPEVETLKGHGGHHGPTVILSGRLCVEGMQGAFLWAHESPTAPGAAQQWARYSLPYYHNKGWSGDAKYLFVDPKGNSSASYTSDISSYNGLVALDDTTVVAFYTLTGSGAARFEDGAEVESSPFYALFALKVSFNTADADGDQTRAPINVSLL